MLGGSFLTGYLLYLGATSEEIGAVAIYADGLTRGNTVLVFIFIPTGAAVAFFTMLC